MHLNKVRKVEISYYFSSFLTDSKFCLKSPKNGFNNNFYHFKLTITSKSLCTQILNLCAARSSLLPLSEKLLLDSQRQVYPLVLNKTLILVAWKISREAWFLKEFQKGLKNLCQSSED